MALSAVKRVSNLLRRVVPRGSSSPRAVAAAKKEYDYVIVGAGSAGCVLANELSADGSSVLLLEAGGWDWNPLVHIPAGVYSVFKDPSINWNMESEEEKYAGGRKIELPRGKVLGGESCAGGAGAWRWEWRLSFALLWCVLVRSSVLRSALLRSAALCCALLRSAALCSRLLCHALLRSAPLGIVALLSDRTPKSHLASSLNSPLPQIPISPLPQGRPRSTHASTCAGTRKTTAAGLQSTPCLGGRSNTSCPTLSGAKALTEALASIAAAPEDSR